GVVAVGHHAKQPHLVVVEYDVDETDSAHLLAAVQAEGLHAELVGL
ncbi:MAG: ATP-binding protein, partial [Gammaproteobacteria bacterium]|nr:ATP-binding protein [Gammaproteobacteria bacterium]